MADSAREFHKTFDVFQRGGTRVQCGSAVVACVQYSEQLEELFQRRADNMVDLSLTMGCLSE